MSDDAAFDRGDLNAEGHVAERPVEAALRPQRFEEFVGQRRITSNLKVFVTAARQRGEALDHLLFAGPPGLGKTTLAYIIANELQVPVHVTSGPAIEHRGMLAGLLTQLEEREVLFIDEIHRLTPVIEEYLYPAMEDFCLDVPSGTGAFSQTLRLNLKPFTLIGATTRSGLLTSPLRDRFGIVERLEHYGPEDIVKIVNRSARIMDLEVQPQAALEIGQRSRGTPRIANRLLRRVRDFAEVQGDGTITLEVTRLALDALEIDGLGLDPMDRLLLTTIIEHYDGGPVGVETLAATLHESRDTIENEIEPYLITQALLQRSPRGRMATRRGFEHLGKIPPTRNKQSQLF
ncbi:MAG: Holliday junction branch migration DNA helicase RuvB [Deltaproteobacteria bacterium]|nr:Holliday junction branch migration DNA helicase RuvB [Deltaproteobacteria bacterium]